MRSHRKGSGEREQVAIVFLHFRKVAFPAGWRAIRRRRVSLKENLAKRLCSGLEKDGGGTVVTVGVASITMARSSVCVLITEICEYVRWHCRGIRIGGGFTGASKLTLQ